MIAAKEIQDALSNHFEVASRLLILPEEVLRMRGDEQIVFTAGNAPLRCGRAIWFRRNEMKSIVGVNRFHPAKDAASG